MGHLLEAIQQQLARRHGAVLRTLFVSSYTSRSVSEGVAEKPGKTRKNQEKPETPTNNMAMLLVLLSWAWTDYHGSFDGS